MGGGGGGGFFSGTRGSGGDGGGGTLYAAAPAGTASDAGSGMASASKTEIQLENYARYPEVGKTGLGGYRGSKTTIQANDPVIFQHTIETPNTGIQTVAGALTPEHGLGGTINTRSSEKGSMQITVYGNPKTGEPSSWVMHEWKETGRPYGNSPSPEYGWVRVPTERAAVVNWSFNEAWLSFQSSRAKK